MSYKPYYEGGWQSGETGATPITPDALNHMEQGIQGALAAAEDPDHTGCYFRTVDGEAEWLNPPMVVGVEYRTAERYNGSPVYVKLIDLGAAANAKAVEHGVTASRFIRYSGTLANAPLPINVNTNFYAHLNVSSSTITLYENGYDGKNVQATLWYCK